MTRIKRFGWCRLVQASMLRLRQSCITLKGIKSIVPRFRDVGSCLGKFGQKAPRVSDSKMLEYLKEKGCQELPNAHRHSSRIAQMHRYFISSYRKGR